jgi:hypothetical protein
MEEKGELDLYIEIATSKECPHDMQSLEALLALELYLNPSGHFQIHYKTCGDKSVRCGFHLRIMN